MVQDYRVSKVWSDTVSFMFGFHGYILYPVGHLFRRLWGKIVIGPIWASTTDIDLQILRPRTANQVVERPPGSVRHIGIWNQTELHLLL